MKLRGIRTCGCGRQVSLSSRTARLEHAVRRVTLPRIHAAGESSEPGPSIPPPPMPPPPPQPFKQSLSRRDILGWVAVGSGLGALITAGTTHFWSNREIRQYEQMRLSAGFKREPDGRVWLRRKNGQWLETRTDAKMAGTILLRDDKGYIYFLAFNNIQQVDLTDDVVLAAVFGDGEWEGAMRKVQARDVDGQTVDVQMDEVSFRNLISVLA